MAIKIFAQEGVLDNSPQPHFALVNILADSEGDITALGAEVCNGTTTVKPLPGSLAYTADLSVGYMLSPSGVWTKFRG
jgi:hypothetical protein